MQNLGPPPHLRSPRRPSMPGHRLAPFPRGSSILPKDRLSEVFPGARRRRVHWRWGWGRGGGGKGGPGPGGGVAGARRAICRWGVGSGGWGTFSLHPAADRGGAGAPPGERPLGATGSRCRKWPRPLGPDERISLRPSLDPPSSFYQPVYTHAWDVRGAVQGASRLHLWSGDNGDTWREP